MDGNLAVSDLSSNDALKGVIDTLGGGVVVYDMAFRVIMANEAAAEVLDVPETLLAPGQHW